MSQTVHSRETVAQAWLVGLFLNGFRYLSVMQEGTCQMMNDALFNRRAMSLLIIMESKIRLQCINDFATKVEWAFSYSLWILFSFCPAVNESVAKLMLSMCAQSNKLNKQDWVVERVSPLGYIRSALSCWSREYLQRQFRAERVQVAPLNVFGLKKKVCIL